MEKSIIPFWVHLVLIGIKSTVGALDTSGIDFCKIGTSNRTINVSCLLSRILLIKGHNCWVKEMDTFGGD